MISTKRFVIPALALVCVISVGGCAFNVIAVQQTPATFTAAPDSTASFTLSSVIKPRLKEGSASRLKADTKWQQSGEIAEGKVFHTKDQVVTVQASNQFEADIVVKNGSLVGFFLPVQKSFVAVETPVELPVNKT